MAILTGLLFTYLLAASFTDTASLNFSSVDRLVDYDYSLNFTKLIPDVRYYGVINAHWAIPDSALSSLEGQALFVKVNASVQNSSAISFLSPLGTEEKQANALLFCRVENGACANGSMLSAEIPIVVIMKQGDSPGSEIALQSEIISPDAITSAPGVAESIIESIRQQLENSSLNISGINMSGGINISPNISFEFPGAIVQGDAANPAKYAKENPLFSLVALGIVILLTGAYLLKSKD